MPRTARGKSESGYYHVMVRGNERRKIFMEDEDKEKYLTLLAKQVEKGMVSVNAYCLMDNHLHLLLKEEAGLTKAMRSIGTAYVIYFNEKYCRTGHLFQDRFKSEAIENENYLFAALRYIHQNPIKASICQKTEDYPWSSDRYYRNPKLSGFVNTEILLSISKNKENAVKEYINLMETPEAKKFLEISEQPKSKQEITKLVEKELKKAGITDMKEREARDALKKAVKRLHEDHRISMRLIAVELGISKGSVQKMLIKK